MKHSLAILIALTLLIGCSKKEPSYDDIKVGMTYDEVVNVMGRPEEIVKGVNVLTSMDTPEYQTFANSHHPSYVIAFLDSVRPYLGRDSTHGWTWPAVDNQGVLVQTTWFMPNAPLQYDTIILALPTGEWTEAETLARAKTTYYISWGGDWEEIDASQHNRYPSAHYRKFTRPVIKPAEVITPLYG
jgi:hypothetical protein